MLEREILYALMGTGFTFGATILGAAMVFLFKNDMGAKTQKIFLGFAAGIMTAAAVWSLLLPAMDIAEKQGQNLLLIIGGGFIVGGAFLMILDGFLPHLHLGNEKPEGLPSKLSRTAKIVIAVTLHNIPEGMAVGLAFAAAAGDNSPGSFASALALAIGMGLQNFPEGAAVSLPLKSDKVSKFRAFICGAASGVVEPIFGVLTVLVAGSISGIMPFILAFAAGAMIYVVVEELIPEARLGEHSHVGTISVMSGFLVMMLLNILLG